MYTDRMQMRGLAVAVVLAGVGALCGLCAPATVAAQSDAEDALRLRNEITTAIGEARCRNLVNCRIVGLGARPCGGPEEYVAYSIWDTDRQHIANLVFEYNLLREDMMFDSDAVGTCEQLQEPGIDCIHDRCVIVPAAN
ncbi:MAG: hypothetical protein AMJ66_08340 [Betaproteobacteria bacterium SG8_40]|nr:MAG: hypothetical protein AMJ66_08340 [Betaproteobacteria bacterium SG8_40]